MQAVILAGGEGRRLKPFTDQIPKPLVPLGEQPIVSFLIRRLKQCGVTDIIMAVNHKAEMIKAALGEGERLNVRIRYSHETKPLSTIGPLKLIDNLDDNFLVVNGDILSDIDFDDIFKKHTASSNMATIAVCNRSDQIDYGVLATDDDGLVVKFDEKPAYHFLVSAGIYLFSKEILSLIPDDKPFGFDDLMKVMLEKNRPVGTYPFDGYWLDVGRVDDYYTAQNDLDKINSWIK